MTAFAKDRGTRWEPFGVTEEDFAAVPERDGIRVVNVRPGGGQGPGRAGWWLRGAAIALAVLAAAAAAVSWQAQYMMVWRIKQATWVAALEAGIPDVGAVVFAALGVALALHGRRAIRPRALNAACIGISLVMNALAAGHGWRDLAIWVMPSALYALASDTLIGVVRAWVLARARDLGETLADDGPTPLSMTAALALWQLRLVLAPRSTLAGFRDWVVTDCPVAPGIRPGHVAQLEAVRQAADEQVAVAIGQRDEAVSHAAALAGQARAEADRSHAAENEVRAELERIRADAREAVTQALDGAAREREELRTLGERQADTLRAELAQARQDADRLAGQVRDDAAARVAALEQASAQLRGERDRLAGAARERDEVRAWAERQIEGLRTQLAQARDDAAQLVGQVREDAAARVADLEASRAGLQEERDRLAAELRVAARQQRHGSTSPAGERQTRRVRRDGPTKRDQMIELAGRRRDLAAVPLDEVSKLANTIAAEIGYSPGTSRRELVRHVRELQAAPAANSAEDEGGQTS